MRRFRRFMLAILCLAGALVGTPLPAQDAEIPPLALPSAAELAAVRGDVSLGISAALARFAGISKHAAAMEAFNAILAEREAKVAEAEPILNGLSDGRGHLALPEYITLRARMYRYVSMLRATSEPEIEVRYHEHILAMRVAEQAANHDEITAHYRWLAQRGLATEERRRVAGSSSNNNVVLRISSTSGNKLLPNPYTQAFRQNTDMDGTPAVITGNLTAYSSFYKPANGAANHAGLTVRATVNSNVAMNRPRVSATAVGNTQIFAQVLLEVHNNEFRVAGSAFTSRTNMWLGCVDTASRCRAIDRTVGRLAGRVFAKKQGEINGQADQQIIAQGKPEMLKQVDLVVAQINVGKQELFAPMVAYGISPDMFLGSDTDGLNMEFRAAAADQLAAPNKPVALPGAMSQIALHDSAANNFGAMFAGMTVDEQRFREAVFDSIGYTPVDAVEPPGGEIAHEITFSTVRPIEARFVEDRVRVQAEIADLTHGTEKFTFEKPVTVHVVYRFETTATGIQFVREVLDCNVDAPRQAKCQATLERFFVLRAEQDEITTLGQMLALLQLKPIQPTCDRGWLQMPLVDR